MLLISSYPFIKEITIFNFHCAPEVLHVLSEFSNEKHTLRPAIHVYFWLLFNLISLFCFPFFFFFYPLGNTSTLYLSNISMHVYFGFFSFILAFFHFFSDWFLLFQLFFQPLLLVLCVFFFFYFFLFCTMITLTNSNTCTKKHIC